LSKAQDWFELIDSLGVYSDTNLGATAVYKPLMTLMVIARAQHGGENHFLFSTIRQELSGHMKGFGQSKNPRPLYPFWYLRNDGFWEISADGKLEVRQGKPEPKVSELLEKNAFGYVPENLWRQLVSDDALSTKLAQKLLDDYWPVSVHDDLLPALGVRAAGSVSSEAEDTRDKAFREKVMIAYNYQCAVCGFDGKVGGVPFGVEAAHIQARSKKLGGGPDLVTNGISLCSLHHKAFDYGVIALSDDFHILVSSRLAGGLQQDGAVTRWIRDFENELAIVPRGDSRPDLDHVRWHRENFFRP
jgi:putative restriction endonuclease